MKLSALKDGTIDRKLIIVSRDLKYYANASHVAQTMRNALDNWSKVYSDLKEIFYVFNNNRIEKSVFNKNNVHSPFPRSYRWADCSAYLNHMRLVRKAREVELPISYCKTPLIYQDGFDNFLPLMGGKIKNIK